MKFVKIRVQRKKGPKEDACIEKQQRGGGTGESKFLLKPFNDALTTTYPLAGLISSGSFGALRTT